jgi:hypothetical protein
VRAIGGAVIGANVEENRGYYDFQHYDDADGYDAWYSVYDSRPDVSDIDQTRWSIARDIGSKHPTILHQLEQFPRRSHGESRGTVDVPERHVDQLGRTPTKTPPFAEDVDVVLLNGGTNDIGLSRLNNPLETAKLDILFSAQSVLYRDLKQLIQAARGRFPNATICVVGYMPYASHQTDRAKARRFLDEYTAEAMPKLNAVVNVVRDKFGIDYLEALAEAAVQNALDFARYQSYFMRKAVAETHREDRRQGNPGIVFVHRGFGLANSFEANDPWCWGVPPGDDMQDLREPACAHDSDTVVCRWASIGHPNRQGSRQTAEQVERRYDQYRTATVGRTVSRLADGRPASVRETLETYGLDPEDGLRYCDSHEIVDSIKVTVDTGENETGGLVGRLNHVLEVDLVVEPGRSGTGERYRVSSEYDPPDKLEDLEDKSNSWWVNGIEDVSDVVTDDGLNLDVDFRFDHHHKFEENSSDAVMIDPMHGRSLAEFDGVATADDDPNPYQVGDSWNQGPLRLDQIRTLRLDVTIPEATRWGLEEVTVEINGHVSTTERVGGVSESTTIDLGRPGE